MKTITIDYFDQGKYRIPILEDFSDDYIRQNFFVQDPVTGEKIVSDDRVFAYAISASRAWSMLQAWDEVNTELRIEIENAISHIETAIQARTNLENDALSVATQTFSGAMGGAVGGAIVGAAAGGVNALPGAIIGASKGATSNFYSALATEASEAVVSALEWATLDIGRQLLDTGWEHLKQADRLAQTSVDNTEIISVGRLAVIGSKIETGESYLGHSSAFLKELSEQALRPVVDTVTLGAKGFLTGLDITSTATVVDAVWTISDLIDKGFDSFALMGSVVERMEEIYELNESGLFTSQEIDRLQDLHADIYTAPADDTGQSLTDHGFLSPDIETTDTIDIPTDSDWFKLTIPEGELYILEVNAQDNINPRLIIRDSSGLFLKATEAPAPAGIAEHWFNGSGEFFIEVDSRLGDTGDYTISMTPWERSIQIVGFDWDEDTVPGGASTGQTIIDGGSIFGTIEGDGDEDWYRVNLNEDRIYFFVLEGAAIEAGARELERPVVHLMSAGGDLIVGKSSKFSGGAAVLEFQPASSGLYYVNAKSLPSGPYYGYGQDQYVVGVGSFELSISSQAAPPIPPDLVGDDEAQATALNVGETVDEYISEPGDDDVYWFNASGGYAYRVAVSAADTGGGSLDDPDIDIGSAPSDLNSDFSHTGRDESVIVATDSGGRIYFGIESEGEWDRPGDYEVSIQQISSPNDEAAADPTTTATLPIDGQGFAQIHFEGDEDWFRVGINPATDASGDTYTSYLFYSTDNDGSNVDVRLQGIYDSSGVRLTHTRAWTPDQFGQDLFASFAVEKGSVVTTGGYTAFAAAYTDDYGQSADKAGSLAVGGSASGKIEAVQLHDGRTRVEDRDWLEMNLTAGRLYQFAYSGVETDLRIQTDLTNNDDLDQDGQDYYFVPDVTGIYYLEVREDNQAGNYSISLIDLSQTDDYAGDISTTSLITPIQDPIDTPEVTTGLLERVYDRDWHAMTIDHGSWYTIYVNENDNFDERLRNVSILIRDKDGDLVDESLIDDNVISKSENRYYFRAWESEQIYLDIFATEEDTSPSRPGIGGYVVEVAEYPVAGLIIPGDSNGVLVTYNDQDPDPDDFDTPHRYYQMDLLANHQYTVNLASSYPERLDRYEFDDVFAANGDKVDMLNYYGEGTSNSGYTLRVWETGRYFLEAEGESNDSVAGESVRMTVSGGTKFDDHRGDARTNSAIIFSNNIASVTGQIDYTESPEFHFDSADVDWFKIELNAGQDYTIFDQNGFASVHLLDPVSDLRLWDNEDGSTYTSPTARSAFLVVEAADSTSTGAYDISIARAPTPGGPDPDVAALDLPAGPETLTSFGQPLEGVATASFTESSNAFSSLFEMAGDTDWFDVELSEDTTYRFDVDTTNTRLSLHDSDGGRILSSINGVLSYYSPIQQEAYLSVEDTASLGVNMGRTYSINFIQKAGDNDPPDTQSLSHTLGANSQSIDLGFSAANDPDDNNLTITVSSLPDAGKIISGGRIVYVGQILTQSELSDLSYTRADGRYGDLGSFSYFVEDPYGGFGFGMASIVVQPDPDDPIRSDAAFKIGNWQVVPDGGDGIATLSLSGDRGPYINSRADVSWASSPGSAIASVKTGGASKLGSVPSGVLSFEPGSQDLTLTLDIESSQLGGNPILLFFASPTEEILILPRSVIVADTALLGSTDSRTLTGSSDGNFLIGGPGDDDLSGGPGDDTLDGGSGFDTANYSGGSWDYSVSGDAEKAVVSGPDGTDTLFGIEALDFHDGGITLDPANTTSILQIWREGTGSILAWGFEGGGVRGKDMMFGKPAGNWDIADIVDLDGNGAVDLLWQRDDGSLLAWYRDGDAITDGQWLGKPGGATLERVADLDGNGTNDLIWKNGNGDLFAWTFDGTMRGSNQWIGQPPSTQGLVDIIDLDGLGTLDLLWQHDNGGYFAWRMDGDFRLGNTWYGRPPGTPEFAGVHDVDANGTPDFLWENADGTLFAWRFDGTIRLSNTWFGKPNGFDLLTVEDVDGNGQADLLWTEGSGNLLAWRFEDGGRLPNAWIGQPAGGNYDQDTIRDITDDGNPDIVWHNDQGQFLIWEMVEAAHNGSIWLGSAGPGSENLGFYDF